MLSFDDSLVAFNGRRALIFDPLALGILRKELVTMFGNHVARGLLTRMGYFHGWVTAKNMKDDFPWDSASDWRRAGGRLHQLQGHVQIEVPEDSEGRHKEHLAWAVWRESYEAEQHLLHLGVSDEAVCWALTGFASGYMSLAQGREVLAKETKCCGQGDAVCTIVAKYADAWGEELENLQTYYQSPCLDHALHTAAEQLKALEQQIRARVPTAQSAVPADMIARDPVMLRCLDLAKRVAKVDSVVLVTGESGAGKERIAKVIHEDSARLRRPFLAVNCGAVSESLLESELFGHKRGAFTGATQDRPGLFEAASGGTLFLDEIGELPLNMQVKLLRVLQERTVRRVGENHDRPIDVRLVAATNRDLRLEVREGRFRQDLYYRLKVIEIHIPPLRDRRADIMPLARHFLDTIGTRLGRNDLSGFTPEAADCLQRYQWEGNVRELQNAIEHAVVMALAGRVTPGDLPVEVREDGGTLLPRPGEQTLAEMERDMILTTLARKNGNQTHTAKELGIGTATLYRKLKKYGAQGFVVPGPNAD
nr:sigma-54-dependent Fis family transcriptional regulator [Acanthopleuribacter pedis]